MTAYARPARGFTLLELMVVIGIIGIMGLAIGLGVSRSDTGLRDEASRMRVVIELAAQSAIVRSTEYGLVPDESGYRFLELVDGRWASVEDESGPLRPHSLPDGLMLAFNVLEPNAIEQEDAPQVLLTSSGAMTAFEAEVYEQETGNRVMLDGYVTGKVMIRDQDEMQ